METPQNRGNPLENVENIKETLGSREAFVHLPPEQSGASRKVDETLGNREKSPSLGRELFLK